MDFSFVDYIAFTAICTLPLATFAWAIGDGVLSIESSDGQTAVIYLV